MAKLLVLTVSTYRVYFISTFLVHCESQSQKSISIKFVSLSFSCSVVEMDLRFGRAIIAENSNGNSNDAIFLFAPAVLNAIKTIRDKKKLC